MKLDDTYYWDGPLPETQAPASPPEPWGETKVVGKPIVRIDAFDRVSGKAVFPSDVVLPDMLHAAILSCPHAHAMVKTVDTSDAEKMPGVQSILKDGVAGTNIPWFSGGGGFASRLFDSHARYQGDEIAAVAADTIYQAWDAIRAIKVDYDVLKHVTSVEDALKPDAPAVREGGNKPQAPAAYQRGDVAAAFKTADVVVEYSFSTPYELHNPMELHGCVAKWDGHHLTIWESTQGVYAVQATMARALGLPLANVRAIGHYMGGGFGGKLDAGKYSVMAALLARKTRRPVRLFVTREQECQSMGNRPGNTITLKVGAKKDGTLVAFQSSVVGSGGAYSGSGTGGVDFVIRELYKCSNVRCENQSVYTNAGPQRAFRGPGHPQGAWALEIAIDALAAKLGMDPLELRRKNFTSFSQSRDGNPPYTSNGLVRCYDEGARAFGWTEARARVPQTGHIKRGVGVAAGMWQGGNGGPPSTAIVKLFSDGSANLNLGASDNGCGTKTWGAQILAEELGVPVDRISIEHADTGTTQFATPSGGSKTVPTESPAIRAAALDVKQQLLAMAADHLKLPASDLELRGGEVVSKSDSSKKAALGQIPAFRSRSLLVGVGYRGPNPPGKAINPFAVQFAEVEVNTKTGEIKVLRFLAAHDSGRVMNLKTFQNQVFGGVTMGIGFALTEDRVMDHKQLGRMLSANLHDYKLPTALDAPADKTIVVVDPHDTECNSTGAKGVGEPATIPTAAAVANAVFHATGLRLTEAPMNPSRVLQALAALKPASKGQKGGE
ncbi:MAG: xanthine dehydrogenase family protein molybdopterin-binding subunit [Acidobacteria bacterium]|nr:xanthine dehydrogenase family protein molybdopterin-binding subunit [Acidobacteriota bacterium]